MIIFTLSLIWTPLSPRGGYRGGVKVKGWGWSQGGLTGLRGQGQCFR